MTISSAVPKTLIAGDTWRWTRDLSGSYPAPTWTVTYHFEKEGASFKADAVASGSSHAISIAATTTAGYKPGRYHWMARATDGSVSETVAGEEGWVDVKPDPAAAGSTDWRSDARKMLDALNATMIGKASSDQLAMTIQGRSLSRFSPLELRQWRDELKREVANEEKGDGPGSIGPLKVRLNRG